MRLVIFLITLLLIVGCAAPEEVAPKEDVSPEPKQEAEAPEPPKDEPKVQVIEKTAGEPTSAPDSVTVEITSNGYEPKAVTISVGGTVNWINKEDANHWPATNAHPTHTLYPGSDITKCPSNEIFDACKSLKKGDTYSFIFTEKGSWKYHDHVNPSLGGVVTVE